MALMADASTSLAISINCARFGCTMKNAPRAPPGSFERLSTDRVERHVDVSDLVFEALSPVIDHVIGAELADEPGMVRGGGCRDMRAAPASKLDGKRAHAAGGAVYQHALPA
jgi:hypothetical protein